MREGWTVTPQAQLAYASADFDDFVDPYGAAVSLSKGESLEGRVGVALGRDASWQDDAGRAVRTHLYGITSLTYEFLDCATVAVSGVDLAAGLRHVAQFLRQFQHAQPVLGKLAVGVTADCGILCC